MRVRWTRTAFARLREFAAFIAAENPKAAVRFATDILDRTRRLEAFPWLGRPGRSPDTRELLVHRHYVIVYQVFRDEVLVLQIWHTAQARR